jgi:DNA-binding CsgD family transcriptional regulator
MATSTISGSAPDRESNVAWRRLRVLRDAVREHVRAGGPGVGTAADALVERIAAEAATLRAELSGLGDGRGPTAGRLGRCLVELTELRHDLREHAAAERMDGLSRVQHALAGLRQIATSSELIDAAPRTLCECGDFDRAMISRIYGSTWLPHRLHVVGDADPELNGPLAEYLQGLAIPLTPTLLETEQVRRKMPALVHNPGTNPRTFPSLIAVSQTKAYVSAPVMPASRVIGFLHADRGTTGRELTAADRDNIFAFAEGFGLIFEHAVLLEQLQTQGDRVKATFAAAGRLLDELCAAEVNLARSEIEPAAITESATRALSTARNTRITSVLTQRELDVFALMAEGATNGQIAERLVIAEGTVKSHVKHILRKMRVSNRAEAVSRYLRIPEESR